MAKSKSQQRREAIMKDQPLPVEDQTSSLPQPVTGPGAVRYAVAQITGIDEKDLGTDDSITWLTSLQNAAKAKGYVISKELSTVSIKDKHVGLFSTAGNLQAAVFQGDDVINNPTSANVTASRLTQRLRVTSSKPADNTEEDEA